MFTKRPLSYTFKSCYSHSTFSIKNKGQFHHLIIFTIIFCVKHRIGVLKALFKSICKFSVVINWLYATTSFSAVICTKVRYGVVSHHSGNYVRHTYQPCFHEWKKSDWLNVHVFQVLRVSIHRTYHLQDKHHRTSYTQWSHAHNVRKWKWEKSLSNRN